MKKIFAILVVFLMLFSLVGCEYSISNSSEVATVSQDQQARNQLSIMQNQPAPSVNWSLERDNVIKRANLWNDPNKIGYLYELSDNGTIVAFYVIKGKVSSLSSYLTGSEMIVKDPNGTMDTGSLLMESPDYDGTFGANNAGVFFFLTDGTYMEWTGRYQLSDRPMKLSQQPLMTYDVTNEK